MKLSEAIRVGSKLHPQGYGNTTVTVRKHSWKCILGFRKCEEVITTCALGAAFEAGDCQTKQTGKPGNPIRGVDASSPNVIQVPDEWLTVLYLERECPQCDSGVWPLFRLIAHLNDDHKWKREEIALLVERVENAPESVISEDKVEPDDVVEEWPQVVSN